MICQWDPNGLVGVPWSGINSLLQVRRDSSPAQGRCRGQPIGGQEFPQPLRQIKQEDLRQRTRCLGTSPRRHLRAARTTFQGNSTPPEAAGGDGSRQGASRQTRVRRSSTAPSGSRKTAMRAISPSKRAMVSVRANQVCWLVRGVL